MAQWEEDRSLPIMILPPTGGIGDASHLSILFRHGEAMFVYIDPQHMWHSCCRQRLSLAEAHSRFPLAMVQLASRRARGTHLTNQYKQ